MHPLRALQRLLTRTLPAGAAASLVMTGLVSPAQTTDPRADVKEKVQTLASERVGPGWQKSVETGLPTELVAFKWEGATEGAVEVRSKAADGSWSEWAHVEGDPLEGPDVGSREYRGTTTTGPVWVGRGIRQVEVRVAEGDLRGLTLHALHPEQPKTRRGTKPAGSAAQPAIVSRAAWGADESWRTVGTGCNGTPEYAPSVRFSVVHHTVNSNTYSAADSPGIMRAIYHLHTHTNRWCDIGYNFVVDRFGTVFEGRAGGIDRPVIGAHAQGFNSGSTGVALLGEFTSTAPSGSAYTSLRNLLAWKLELHGVNPRGTVSAGGRTISTISGHRDVGSTACPGDRLYALLPQLRNDVAAARGAGGGADIVSWEAAREFRVGISTGASFQWGPPWLAGIAKPAAFGSGDVTGDGKADIVSWEPINGGQFMVGVSTGSSFVWQRWLQGIQQPGAFAVRDFNGDGRADIVSWEMGGEFRVGVSTGSSFSWSGPWLRGISQPTAFGAGDVNGDGKADIVSWEPFGNGQFMVGISTGSSFSWQRWLGGIQQPGAFAVGAFNGDGRADIVSWEAAGEFRVGISTGSSFQWGGPWLTGISRPGSFGAGDVNADGRADIVSWEPFSNGQFMVGISTGGSFAWQRWLQGIQQPGAFAVGNFNG